ASVKRFSSKRLSRPGSCTAHSSITGGMCLPQFLKMPAPPPAYGKQNSRIRALGFAAFAAIQGLAGELGRVGLVDMLPNNGAQKYRSAVIGSTFVARNAGMRLAAMDTDASTNAVTTKVSTSVELMP